MSWLVASVLIACLVAYASNRISLRTVSVETVVAVAVIYGFSEAPDGNSISLEKALSGFASEALVAIVCLIMLGQVLT